MKAIKIVMAVVIVLAVVVVVGRGFISVTQWSVGGGIPARMLGQ